MEAITIKELAHLISLGSVTIDPDGKIVYTDEYLAKHNKED